MFQVQQIFNFSTNVHLFRQILLPARFNSWVCLREVRPPDKVQMFNKWKQPSCHSLSAWGSSEGLSQVSSAVKDREGEAEHRFMQNMTRLPSYFTLACLGGKWPQETELQNRMIRIESGQTWRNETLLGKPSRTRSAVFFLIVKKLQLGWLQCNFLLWQKYCTEFQAAV